MRCVGVCEGTGWRRSGAPCTRCRGDRCGDGCWVLCVLRRWRRARPWVRVCPIAQRKLRLGPWNFVALRLTGSASAPRRARGCTARARGPRAHGAPAGAACTPPVQMGSGDGMSQLSALRLWVHCKAWWWWWVRNCRLHATAAAPDMHLYTRFVPPCLLASSPVCTCVVHLVPRSQVTVPDVPGT